MSPTLAKIYTPNIVRRVLNLWPPFWGAGIKITELSDDFRYCRVRLKRRWWNQNANRSQYGGSIFSLTDPIYSMMLMGVLGEQYYVWDKQASIDFIKPGTSELHAEFVISNDVLDEIQRSTLTGDKHFPEFVTHVKNRHGDVVSTIERTLYIRKKAQFREQSSVKESLQ